MFVRSHQVSMKSKTCIKMCSIGNPFFLAHGYAVYEVTMKSFMQSGEWCNVSEMWKIQYLWILPALQPVRAIQCTSVAVYKVMRFHINLVLMNIVKLDGRGEVDLDLIKSMLNRWVYHHKSFADSVHIFRWFETWTKLALKHEPWNKTVSYIYLHVYICVCIAIL